MTVTSFPRASPSPGGVFAMPPFPLVPPRDVARSRRIWWKPPAILTTTPRPPLPPYPPPPLLDCPPTSTASTRRKLANQCDARASRIPDVQGSCRPRMICRGAGSRTPPSRRLLGRSLAALTARVDPWAVFRSRRRWRKCHPQFGSCRCHDAAAVVVVVPIACCFFDAAPAEPDHRRSTTEGYGADDPER